jgi:hypothetical protein
MWTWIPAGIAGLFLEFHLLRLLDRLEGSAPVSRHAGLDGWLLAALFGWLMIFRLSAFLFLLPFAALSRYDLRHS